MAVSKAYLRRLSRVVKDREMRAVVRAFLIKYGDEINTNKLIITFTGEMYYQGSIAGVTCYKMWGKYRNRRKSSLTGKRFRKDKAFRGSRESAERFKLGNQLASKVYRKVDEEKKQYSLFCFLKKKAIALIKGGKSIDEAREDLMDYLKSCNLLALELQQTTTVDQIRTIETTLEQKKTTSPNKAAPKRAVNVKIADGVLVPIAYSETFSAEWKTVDERVFAINSS